MGDLRVVLMTLASACLVLAWPAARGSSLAVASAWADEVLYFAIVDRFADGDPGSNVNVDRTARGAFHGGDLKGCCSTSSTTTSAMTPAI